MVDDGRTSVFMMDLKSGRTRPQDFGDHWPNTLDLRKLDQLPTEAPFP